MIRKAPTSGKAVDTSPPTPAVEPSVKIAKPPKRYPMIENAGGIIVEAYNKKMAELYGDPLPQEIARRFADEFSVITGNGDEVIFRLFTQ